MLLHIFVCVCVGGGVVSNEKCKITAFIVNRSLLQRHVFITSDQFIHADQ